METRTANLDVPYYAEVFRNIDFPLPLYFPFSEGIYIQFVVKFFTKQVEERQSIRSNHINEKCYIVSHQFSVCRHGKIRE